MCSIQFECCPSTTVTLGPIKINLIILSLYLSTVFQSFRAGERAIMSQYHTVENLMSWLKYIVAFSCHYCKLLFVFLF